MMIWQKAKSKDFSSCHLPTTPIVLAYIETQNIQIFEFISLRLWITDEAVTKFFRYKW